MQLAQPRALQFHAGVLFASKAGPATLVHFATHQDLRDEVYNAGTHGAYVYVRLELEDEYIAPACAYFRDVIEQNRGRLTYSAFYAGGTFDSETGAHAPAPGELGMTCATFVVGLLLGAGIDLVAWETWEARPEDVAWLRRITRVLELSVPTYTTANVVAELAACTNFVRIRPEEVGGAATLHQRATFESVRAPAAYLRTGLFVSALLDQQEL